MMRIKQRAAVITAAAAALAVIGGAASYAATSAGAVSVPNSGGELDGIVFVCVNTNNESQQYVELGHPAPGNCAPGYLQYTANQPQTTAATPSLPAALVNSETFTATAAGVAAGGSDIFTVKIPKGSHITGTPSATDLDATVAHPDTVTVTNTDNVTGAVTVTYSAGTAGHNIQITYGYSL